MTTPDHEVIGNVDTAGPLRYDGAPRRRTLIRRLVEETGFRSSRELSRLLGVSEMTIRRDVERLDETGLLRRVHGGATPPQRETVARSQLRKATEERTAKAAIGAKAAGILEPSVVVAFDAGAHAVAVAEHVDPAMPLSVVTSSLPVANVFADRGHVHLILLGGVYQPLLRFFAFQEDDPFFEQLRVDVLFLGTTALRNGAMYVGTASDAAAKRALMAIADHVVLIAIAPKFALDQPSKESGGRMLHVASFADCEMVVTDSRIRDLGATLLDDFVGEVIIADLGRPEDATT